MVASALRVLEAEAMTYRRTWKGSVFSTFVNPVLFLAAMGLGLGTLVDRGVGGEQLAGFGYLEFLAPGLLAAHAMQSAVGEGSWPVIAGVKWRKTYHSALATPVRARDLAAGRLSFAAVRLLLAGTVFAGVMTAFGAAPPLRAALAVLPAVLTGLAFVAPVMAYAVRQEEIYGLTNLFRFGVVPMFLFSGTFFPIDQLPSLIQPLAVITPLWHGVELTRGAALGVAPALAVAWHVSYLALWFAAGTALALRSFNRRLVT